MTGMNLATRTAIKFCSNNIVKQNMGKKEKAEFLRWYYDRKASDLDCNKKAFYMLVNDRVRNMTMKEV